MKRSANKIALSIALLLTIGVMSSFATPAFATPGFTAPTDRSDLIKASFQKDFKKAEIIGLETTNTYNKLTFKMNDMVLYAFYSDNGDLLAVTRNIKSTQLPIQLLLDIKRDYANYWITDLFEFNGDGINSYYVTLENADTAITLRANGSDNWQFYSKRSK
ncbi:MAG: hypothetical protein JST42_01295 [Bacteroidetes bacterium]|nr:hypothetical protein [Bacteroidota bacterium]